VGELEQAKPLLIRFSAIALAWTVCSSDTSTFTYAWLCW